MVMQTAPDMESMPRILPLISDVHRGRVLGIFLTPGPSTRALHICCRLARVCVANGLPWILSVPTETVDLRLSVLTDLATVAFHYRIIHQCAYGHVWRGPVKLYIGNISAEDCNRLYGRCNGRDSYCPYLRRPHEPLRGYGISHPTTRLADAIAHSLVAPVRLDQMGV